jgi:endo-1,4-beta-xylanase
MEFFFNVVKIIGGLYVLLMVLSIIALFFKRFRKAGIIILILLVGATAFAYLKFGAPKSYQRSYLSKTPELSEISLRPLLKEKDFFLGTIGDVRDITRSELNQNFNSLTPENALKMEGLFVNREVGRYNFSRADSIVNSAIAENLRVRGHVLVWGKLSDFFKSPDLEEYLRNFPEEQKSKVLHECMTSHIETVLSHFKGRIFDWDVVNEPLEIFGNGELENNVYLRYLGPDYIKNAFKIAHNVDPEVKLFLNEQLMNYRDARAEGFYELVKSMKEEGVPIHGVGLQSHIATYLPSTENLKKYIEKFADLGLTVELTEVDARLRLFDGAEDPYEAQADFYGQLLKACLESSHCTGLTFWGYTDAHSWMDSPGFTFFAKPNEPYLFDAEMNPKPVLKALAEVLE